MYFAVSSREDGVGCEDGASTEWLAVISFLKSHLPGVFLLVSRLAADYSVPIVLWNSALAVCVGHMVVGGGVSVAA